LHIITSLEVRHEVSLAHPGSRAVNNLHSSDAKVASATALSAESTPGLGRVKSSGASETRGTTAVANGKLRYARQQEFGGPRRLRTPITGSGKTSAAVLPMCPSLLHVGLALDLDLHARIYQPFHLNERRDR